MSNAREKLMQQPQLGLLLCGWPLRLTLSGVQVAVGRAQRLAAVAHDATIDRKRAPSASCSNAGLCFDGCA
jgi:hypothetical protein